MRSNSAPHLSAPAQQRCLKALQKPQAGSSFALWTRPTRKAQLTIPKGVEDFKADKKYGPATEIVSGECAGTRAKRRFSKTLRDRHKGVEADDRVLGSARRHDRHIRR